MSESFRLVSPKAGIPENITPHQSRWRGLTEVVSAAALLHDIGHVPFGHTLEDEYTGLFDRHDNLAGPRLHAMLFNEHSELQRVFGEDKEQWIPKVTNEGLAQLIYVILNWKEDVGKRQDFRSLLGKTSEKLCKASAQETSKETATREAANERVRRLSGWYESFQKQKLFAPFMSDIIGNTICADLLDYLPRDRLHLGMEPRHHSRLHRSFVIRDGTHYGDTDGTEGRRLTILVGRQGRGGQRVDVATAVLSVMRERYEMAERVFYHHKKAAASAMLAHLFELVKDEDRPRDDDDLYPTPWDAAAEAPSTPHMVHLSDSGLIEHLGRASVSDEHRDLQRRLYSALRTKRSEMYRTLLVIDVDLAESGGWDVGRIAIHLRGKDEQPSAAGRHKLERELVEAAGASPGDVLVYCPSPSMQSKEVDARLEIKPGDVRPLSQQVEQFKYSRDVAILQDYYKALWRAYVFVSPRVFGDEQRCRAIVHKVCKTYSFPRYHAYRKVRGHSFSVEADYLERVMTHIKTFMDEVPWYKDLTNADVLLAMVVRTAAELTGSSEDKAATAIRRQLGAELELVELRRLLDESETSSSRSRVQARIDLVSVHPDEAILNQEEDDGLGSGMTVAGAGSAGRCHRATGPRDRATA